MPDRRSCKEVILLSTFLTVRSEESEAQAAVEKKSAEHNMRAYFRHSEYERGEFGKAARDAGHEKMSLLL